MQYITAAEAGRRIGVSEKTVRLWVQAGKLTAHHPAKNRLAIPVPEVERLARERQQYIGSPAVGELATTTASSGTATGPDVGTMQLLLDNLCLEVDSLRKEVKALQDRLNRADTAIAPGAGVPGVDTTRSTGSRAGRPPGRAAVSPGLPAGAILAKDFAEAHGVNARTFRDQITKGAYGEIVEAESRPKPGREKKGETEYYLLPDQQEKAVDYWIRHKVIPDPAEIGDQDQAPDV